MRWAVILAGGSGSRFWPLSTPSRPKQVLPLTGPLSTAEETILRLDGLIPPERILLVTGEFLAKQLQPLLGLPMENVLVEPCARSTAPALFWATHEAHRRDPEAEILSLHADWTVGDGPAFRQAAALALDTAREHGVLVTVGVVPTRPETGFGYIVPGPSLDDDARHVARFSEKPDAATALDLMAEGALWNSGLFAWTAVDLFDQVSRHTPELAPWVSALDQGDPAAFFERVTPVSIDVGLLERSTKVAVVPGTFSWDDVGTWDALARVRERDTQGNVTSGNVFMLDTHDSVVWSDGDPVVCFGVQDLVVVRANGRVLVAHRKRAADLKKMLERLPDEIRELE